MRPGDTFQRAGKQLGQMLNPLGCNDVRGIRPSRCVSHRSHDGCPTLSIPIFSNEYWPMKQAPIGRRHRRRELTASMNPLRSCKKGCLGLQEIYRPTDFEYERSRQFFIIIFDCFIFVLFGCRIQKRLKLQVSRQYNTLVHKKLALRKETTVYVPRSKRSNHCFMLVHFVVSSHYFSRYLVLCALLPDTTNTPSLAQLKHQLYDTLFTMFTFSFT